MGRNILFFLPHPQGVGGGPLKILKSQLGHFLASEKEFKDTYPPIYGVRKFNGNMTLEVKGQGHAQNGR